MAKTRARALIKFDPGKGGERKDIHVVEKLLVGTTAAVQVAGGLVQCYYFTGKVENELGAYML